MKTSGNPTRNDLCFYGIIAIILLGVLWVKHVWLYEPSGATCFKDELIYKENASAFFEGIRIRGAHYPPLYSLVLAPAFFFQNWYDVMIRINGLLSTLLVIPVWLLARSFLNCRTSLIAALLTMIIPFQAIYPAYILSENLFMLIFAFAVLLAMKGVSGGKFQAALFGMTLGLAYLTRYLMLPAIPILVVFWVALPWLMQQRGNSNFTMRDTWPNILIMCLGFAAIYSPWLIYTNIGGFPLLKSTGLKMITDLKIPEAPVGNFVMWSGAYAAYLILALAPFFLPLLLDYFSAVARKIQIRGMSRETAFAWLLLLLTICYWLLAAQHSFRAKYNYPHPKYLIGRYLMFLTPLYIVAGLTALERLLRFKAVVKWQQIAAAAFISGAGVYMARWVLHGQGIWGFPGWFANIEFSSPDAFSYSNLITLLIGLAGIAILGSIFYAFSCRQGKYRRRFTIAAYFIIFLWQTAIFVNAIKRASINIDGIHARKLAPLMLAYASSIDKTLPLYYAIGGVSSLTMKAALRFWGTTVTQERLHPLEGDSVVAQPAGPFLMLSKDAHRLPELLSYKVGKNTYYLYEMDQKNKPFYPELISVGPEPISAGKPFNRQPSGDSVIWLITEKATQWTVVVFDNHELKTTVEKPSLVTAIVPLELFSNPGEIKIYLKDRLTGAIGKHSVIKVVK